MHSKRSVADHASLSRRIPRFDAEFIEHRFQLHREEMASLTAKLASDIVIEVAAAVDQARRKAARNLPAHLQETEALQ